MKLIATIGMLPAIVIWAVTPRPVPSAGVVSAAVIEPKNTLPENITARRADSNTFRLRWSAAADLPPAIEVHYVRDDVVNAGTVAEPPAVPPSRQLKPHQVKRVALRTNICSRHGQRKVMVGKHRWRCRR